MSRRLGLSARAGVRDRGAAVVWVLGCGVVVLVVAYALTARSLAVLARHRAESAADLAALAAASRIGVGGDPCATARAVASRNAATVVSCSVVLGPAGRTGADRVRVRGSVRLPIVGTVGVTASARAGRLPPAAGASPPGVWHADAVRVHHPAATVR